MPHKASRVVGDRLQQGDILRDIEFLEGITEIGDAIEVSLIVYPLAVVLSQDCDLFQDHECRKGDKLTGDKLLVTALLAPIYNSEHVFLGEHLSEIERTCQKINRKKSPGESLLTNQNQRYHTIDLGEGSPIPVSVVDFKHFFTVAIDTLLLARPGKFVCTLEPLFREDLSQRFASYLSRIGLPVDEPKAPLVQAVGH